MDPSASCPFCHTTVRPTDFFCFNCGKNLHLWCKFPQKFTPLKPLSTALETQVLIYLGSIFLPPMGFIWGRRYLRQSDQTSKTVGLIACLLTSVSLVITAFYLINIISSVNKGVNQQIQNLQEFQ